MALLAEYTSAERVNKMISINLDIFILECFTNQHLKLHISELHG